MSVSTRIYLHERSNLLNSISSVREILVASRARLRRLRAGHLLEQIWEMFHHHSHQIVQLNIIMDGNNLQLRIPGPRPLRLPYRKTAW